MDDDEPTDLFDRTCEVVVLDDDDHEARCGRSAAEKVHGWWMCCGCLIELSRPDGGTSHEESRRGA